MTSKMVADRQRSSESVQAAARTHAEPIAVALSDVLGAPKLKESMAEIVMRSAGALGMRTEQMVSADEAHIKEQGEDAGARAGLDQHLDQVRAVLVDFRQTAAGVVGEAYLRQLGFEGRTPERVVEVERLAQRVVDNLDHVKPLPSRVPGFAFAPAPWKAHLSQQLAPLIKARKALAQERRESEVTLVNKQEAIEVYDRTFSSVATLVSAFLAIAGERELARRVRPSTRRRGRTVGDMNDPSDPDRPAVPSPTSQKSVNS